MNSKELQEKAKASMPLSKFLEAYCGYKIIGGHGENVRMVCPNHTNKNNMAGLNCGVNDVKGVGYCFHCGEGFSYLSALIQAKNIDIKEACRTLAEILGIDNGEEFVYTADDIRQLYISLCHEWLLSHKDSDGKAAWEYLMNRGFTEASIKRFRIGFNPEGAKESWVIIQEMFSKGISLKAIREADIVRLSKKSGKKYVAFSGRVTMMAGKNVYGRTIDAQNAFRHNYTNSGNSLFNDVALAKGRNVVFVVEAAFDAISIEQYCRELKNNSCCIATLGTHGIPNEELVSLLKEAAPAEVVVIPDCDPWYNNGQRHAVGQKAGLEKARMLEAAGFAVRVMVLPFGVDPNDLSKNGVPAQEFYDKYYCRAITPAKFAVYCEGHFYKGLGKSHSANIAFLNNVKKVLASGKVVIRKEIIDYLAQLTREPVEDINNIFNHSLEKSYALSFFRTCRLNGISDEDTLRFIQKALTQSGQ